MACQECSVGAEDTLAGVSYPDPVLCLGNLKKYPNQVLTRDKIFSYAIVP